MNKPRYSSVPTGDYDSNSGYDGNISRNNIPSNDISFLRQTYRDQENGLDVLSNSVLKLGEMSLNISKEIDLQNRMLNSLEDDVSDANDQANIITKRTQELIKKSGGTRNFCVIVVLTITLVILILAVLYT